MRREDYGRELGAAAKTLVALNDTFRNTKVPELRKLSDADERLTNAVLTTGSYAEAARLIGRDLGIVVSPGIVRRDFQRLAKRHGVYVPKQPHTVAPKPDGFAKIVAALGRMKARLEAALTYTFNSDAPKVRPKRKRKGGT